MREQYSSRALLVPLFGVQLDLGLKGDPLFGFVGWPVGFPYQVDFIVHVMILQSEISDVSEYVGVKLDGIDVAGARAEVETLR